MLATDIFQYFHRLDNPPADEIFVPADHIKYNKEDGVYNAVVRFVTNYCSRKVHNIRISFSVNDKGRFITNTWKYV